MHLVAAELCKLNLIPCVTSRNAKGADLVVTNEEGNEAFVVQVKTNTAAWTWWVMPKNITTIKASPNYIFVFVNVKKHKDGTEQIEYYVVPSKVVAAKSHQLPESSSWGDRAKFELKDAAPYRDKWSLFVH